ncbi:hypothetical protein FNV43_RR24513 [Rhamnella rubrinervis]|uniref:Uncharacterized protein n=1 Tax=Rhamnella rubrinervis TaxID=2594499 RepID=A0A8K0DRB7_9ROSA|nr:hypothetical protein FNV43_RR24513 [Rhamnella rubrinervis]
MPTTWIILGSFLCLNKRQPLHYAFKKLGLVLAEFNKSEGPTWDLITLYDPYQASLPTSSCLRHELSRISSFSFTRRQPHHFFLGRSRQLTLDLLKVILLFRSTGLKWRLTLSFDGPQLRENSIWKGRSSTQEKLDLGRESSARPEKVDPQPRENSAQLGDVIDSKKARPRKLGLLPRESSTCGGKSSTQGEPNMERQVFDLAKTQQYVNSLSSVYLERLSRPKGVLKIMRIYEVASRRGTPVMR